MILAIALTILMSSHSVQSQTPPKTISSCQIDLNNDGSLDVAYLVRDKAATALKVKMGKSEKEIALSTRVGEMNLFCRKGSTVKQTEAGSLGGKTFKTPGAYVELIQPEGASIVYFWTDKQFREIWTSN